MNPRKKGTSEIRMDRNEILSTEQWTRPGLCLAIQVAEEDGTRKFIGDRLLPTSAYGLHVSRRSKAFFESKADTSDRFLRKWPTLRVKDGIYFHRVLFLPPGAKSRPITHPKKGQKNGVHTSFGRNGQCV